MKTEPIIGNIYEYVGNYDGVYFHINKQYEVDFIRDLQVNFKDFPYKCEINTFRDIFKLYKTKEMKNEETTPVVGDAWEYTEKSTIYHTTGVAYRIKAIESGIWIEDNESIRNPDKKPYKFGFSIFESHFKKVYSAACFSTHEPPKQWVPQFMEKVVVWDNEDTKDLHEKLFAFKLFNGKICTFPDQSQIERCLEGYGFSLIQWDNMKQYKEPVTFSQEQAIEIISKHTGTPVDQIVIL